MITETDRSIVRLFRIIVIGMALMLINQVVNVVLGATRSCPVCPVTAEKP